MRSIFIDYANLRNMLRGLGIHNCDFGALRQILTNEIGQDESGQVPPLAHAPIITIPHHVSSRFVRRLTSLGFQCIRYTARTNQDDEQLIALIEALDPQQVTQIVLASSDSDFNPVLQEKKVEGIQIYWVASRLATNPSTGEPMLSPQMEIEFEKTFTFVELARYKSRLELSTCPA